MIIYTSVFVAIVGVLMYALCVNAKLQEIGRISYAMGLLAFLMLGVPHLLSIAK